MNFTPHMLHALGNLQSSHRMSGGGALIGRRKKTPSGFKHKGARDRGVKKKKASKFNVSRLVDILKKMSGKKGKYVVGDDPDLSSKLQNKKGRLDFLKEQISPMAMSKISPKKLQNIADGKVPAHKAVRELQKHKRTREQRDEAEVEDQPFRKQALLEGRHGKKQKTHFGRMWSRQW